MRYELENIPGVAFWSGDIPPGLPRPLLIQNDGSFYVYSHFSALEPEEVAVYRVTRMFHAGPPPVAESELAPYGGLGPEDIAIIRIVRAIGSRAPQVAMTLREGTELDAIRSLHILHQHLMFWTGGGIPVLDMQAAPPFSAT